ncbi:MAG: ferritin family protein [candidate division Zixibacteria bacterium]|nr:ferritin family protein [candidate division Zixibacteria bacterium]
MSDSKEQIAATLKHAIRGEEEGFNYYNALSQATKNPDAKRKLEGLRDDEVRHKQTLMALYEKYVGGDMGPLPSDGVSALSKVLEGGRLKGLKSEMEFITLAIEVEIATMKFYQEKKTMIDDAEFGAILEKLAAEEQGHFELLQAEKDALGGNYGWFSYGDSAPMEH